MFPILKALRYCDSNIPTMDKILFLVMRADKEIDNSVSMLNDEDLFGSPGLSFLLDVKRNWMRCLEKEVIEVIGKHLG